MVNSLLYVNSPKTSKPYGRITVLLTALDSQNKYNDTAWSPYLLKDITALETVQRRASRLVLGPKWIEMTYEDRCKMLNWPTLEKCRKYLSVVDYYKTELELNSLLFNESFECSKVKSTRANHNYKLHAKLAIINCYKHSFFKV